MEGLPPPPGPPPGGGPLDALPPPVVSDRRVPCPRCGELTEPGQEVCLRCGALVGRAYRRPPSWRLPAALAAVGVLLIGAGVGFGVAELTRHKSSKRKTAPVSLNPTTPPTTAPPTATTTQTTSTPTEPPTSTTNTTPTTPSSGGAASGGALTTWPAATKGWTVLLLITKNESQARSRARAAAQKAISAGVIHGAGFDGFGKDQWIAFMGQYSSRRAATKAAKGYAAKGFSGKPRLVKPKK